MANTNQPRGLVPVNSPYGGIKWTSYRVDNSCGSNLYIGDPVDRAAAGTVTIATAGAGNPVIGAITALFDSTGKPKSYMVAGADNYTACVADDPNQEFVVQEDGLVTDLALTDEGYNVNLVAGSGSTVTGLSGWQLNSDSNGASATIQMRIIRKHAEANNAIGDYCRWVCKINYHRNSVGVVGAGV